MCANRCYGQPPTDNLGKRQPPPRQKRNMYVVPGRLLDWLIQGGSKEFFMVRRGARCTYALCVTAVRSALVPNPSLSLPGFPTVFFLIDVGQPCTHIYLLSYMARPSPYAFIRSPMLHAAVTSLADAHQLQHHDAGALVRKRQCGCAGCLRWH